MNEFLTIDTDLPVHLPATESIKPYKIYDLLEENDPGLFTISEEFDFEDKTKNAIELASSLVETCRKHKALGLAAIQCGIPTRVFVSGYGDSYVAHFNPKVLTKSEDEVYNVEGCLSYPGLFLDIQRPKSITVEYQDYQGVVRKASLDGLTARVFQHEMDHLDGITFTKICGPVKLHMGMKKRKKNK